MPGENETAVETPVVEPAKDLPEKKDLAEAEEKTEEKKDEEKDTSKAEENEEKKKKEVKEKKIPAPPPPAVHKKDFEQDVVYLYQFNRCRNIPSISPYCLLTETWIKFNNIKYENVNHNSKLRSKRGLLPFIELNGEEIADSDIIIKSLGAKFEKDMDANLTPEQRTINHAMVSMVDNHLLWINAQWRTRSMDNLIKGYKLNLQHMTNSKVPNGLLAFAFKHTFLRKITRKVKAMGIGGKSNEEVDKLGEHDLKVLSELLGEKQFFFGDEPSSLDLHAFVQLALLVSIDKEVSCPIRDYLESECTNLVGLYTRMRDQAWGDHWEEAMGDKLEMNPHIPKPEPPVEEKKEEKKEEKETADEKKEEEKEKADEKKEEKEKPENKETTENKESEEK